jgi:hypothetical protein
VKIVILWDHNRRTLSGSKRICFEMGADISAGSSGFKSDM